MARVASVGPHFGEEPPLTGRRGSATVFFSHCNLHCLFCQNHQISHEGLGEEFSAERLAAAFLKSQEMACHNVNLVTPTPWVPQILEALALACRQGLTLPLVYNSGGYDSIETLKLLDGVIDIYLPDMKYGNDSAAARLSDVPDYVRVNRAAVREMFRQVGLLKVDRDGIALSGLIVRHLVLPHGLAGSREVFRFLADELSEYIAVSLMAQYHPRHRACTVPELNRPISPEEYEQACRWFQESGLMHGYLQSLAATETGLPDFTDREPFDWSSC